MIGVRETKLVNWIDSQQQQALRAMSAAIDARDVQAHAVQTARFNALAEVWEQLRTLQNSDNEGAI